jgi:hypothetical protein
MVALNVLRGEDFAPTVGITSKQSRCYNFYQMLVEYEVVTLSTLMTLQYEIYCVRGYSTFRVVSSVRLSN